MDTKFRKKSKIIKQPKTKQQEINKLNIKQENGKKRRKKKNDKTKVIK